MQTEIHVNRCRVVIGPRPTPVGANHRHIQIPTGDLGRAGVHHINRTCAECNRSQTGRTTETFLRPTIGSINIPFINFDGHPAQRGHAVYEQQCTGFVNDLRNLFERLRCTGRSFRMHDPQYFGFSFCRTSITSSTEKTSPNGR